MLIGELSLEVSIAVLSTLAIQVNPLTKCVSHLFQIYLIAKMTLFFQEESNISDQLGICLAFFFILELSEWVCTLTLI